MTTTSATAPVQMLSMFPRVLLGGGKRAKSGPFALVTQNLLSLGSFPIESLAQSSKADLEGLDLPYVSVDVDADSPSSRPTEPRLMYADTKDDQISSISMHFVAQLHQTCSGAFGNADSLKWEFIEDEGPNRKQCILTITRPNGQRRSYRSEPTFSRKTDAKARAAAIAVQMGALEFIVSGNKIGRAKYQPRNIVLAPLDSKNTVKKEVIKEEDLSTDTLDDDDASSEIKQCCKEWRAGLIQPRWVIYQERKGDFPYGCALIIELSAHSQKVYSVPTSFPSPYVAKQECSSVSIKQGVLDYIKFGNGQKTPALAPLEDPLEFDNESVTRESTKDKTGRARLVTLQNFFDSLPKPFPENLGNHTALSLNAPTLLNSHLQLAKGARLSSQFYFIEENHMHGCILRLERPEETRTYLVDPKFGKRSDAKAAVCLLAISQGAKQYITSLVSAVENRITQEMRKKANEQILPILGSEYARLRHGLQPQYTFSHDNGAFGCTVVLELSDNPSEDEIRSWTVEPAYRSKTDAKTAAIYSYGTEMIEFIRFRGEPAPIDHDPLRPYRRQSSGSQDPDVDIQGEFTPTFSSFNPPNNQRNFKPNNNLMRPTAHPQDFRYRSRQDKISQGQEKYTDKKYSYNNTSQNRNQNRQKWIPRRNRSPGYGADLDSSVEQTPVDDTISPISPQTYGQTHHRTPSRNYSSGSNYNASESREEPYNSSPQQQYAPPNANQQYQQPYEFVSQSPTNRPNPEYPSPTNYYHPGFQQHSYPYPMYSYPPNMYPFPPPSSSAPHSAPEASTAPYYAAPYGSYYPDPMYYPPYTNPSYPPSGFVYAPPVPQPALQAAPEVAPAFSVPTPSDVSPPTSSIPEAIPSNARPVQPAQVTSSNANNDNNNRRRSRENTPDDVEHHMHKKQRSESSLPPLNIIKQEVSVPGQTSENPEGETSFIQQLIEHCRIHKMDLPEFGSKLKHDDEGNGTFSVWIVLGNERMELPNTFNTENEGRERVARQVLKRLRSQKNVVD